MPRGEQHAATSGAAVFDAHAVTFAARQHPHIDADPGVISQIVLRRMDAARIEGNVFAVGELDRERMLRALRG